LAVTVGVKAVADSYARQSDNIRDVGIATAENGGSISVGSISTSQSPSSSTSSTQSATGESIGELGGGSSSLAEASKTGDTIIIGNRNITAQASDNASSFADVRNALDIEASATGAINDDSNVDQQPVIDDQNAELINQPSNGGNSVF
jgi:hypothetical protein